MTTINSIRPNVYFKAAPSSPGQPPQQKNFDKAKDDKDKDRAFLVKSIVQNTVCFSALSVLFSVLETKMTPQKSFLSAFKHDMLWNIPFVAIAVAWQKHSYDKNKK